mmetsp:Transcript_15869/g.34239  ORF Transcript_15869/g.34239 Transcript_15869/m.34239 type:complete len:324 (+) Transcript_15869:107-1078(+)|eukprot:CAMPEP_0202891442 /NCGR_PEP_ID=MMETSP1392-20130828/1496_1 /ASSEMBLY_ACC=CAM_ASM_000868 /TAXON_ID=225041 /ORGANISM="Chlamydomonas chlamydogama, Strain SAG 11-48b" /LENGTH=323 /DNA_ID=CAMNT_0049575189 /DNA_START=107 /DNA_END=1078 /DNA_ORIENTATION=+
MLGRTPSCGQVGLRAGLEAQNSLRAPIREITRKGYKLSTVIPQASRTDTKVESKETTQVRPNKLDEIAGLGDTLGPIGLTYGGEVKDLKVSKVNKSGVALGPISLSFGEEFGTSREPQEYSSVSRSGEQPTSIHSMTTEEWRAKYEKDGMVDLWVEEEFNAGSRLVGGRAVHKGGLYGIRTGEGVSVSNATKHKITIHNHFQNNTIEVEVPEDRYILWEAEDNGLELPYACRMGCCTACAVKIVEGEMYQPEALGISQELKEQGYALMCVGFPMSDMVLQTVTEDEVYDLQFGQAFAQQALDPANPDYIERDDFALSVANMDE